MTAKRIAEEVAAFFARNKDPSAFITPHPLTSDEWSAAGIGLFTAFVEDTVEAHAKPAELQPLAAGERAADWRTVSHGFAEMLAAASADRKALEARVTELLTANNAEVEKRRDLEQQVALQHTSLVEWCKAHNAVCELTEKTGYTIPLGAQIHRHLEPFARYLIAQVEQFKGEAEAGKNARADFDAMMEALKPVRALLEEHHAAAPAGEANVHYIAPFIRVLIDQRTDTERRLSAARKVNGELSSRVVELSNALAIFSTMATFFADLPDDDAEVLGALRGGGGGPLTVGDFREARRVYTGAPPEELTVQALHDKALTIYRAAGLYTPEMSPEGQRIMAAFCSLISRAHGVRARDVFGLPAAEKVCPLKGEIEKCASGTRHPCTVVACPMTPKRETLSDAGATGP